MATNYSPLTSVDFDKIQIESYDRLTLFSKASSEILVMLEDLKDFTLSQSADRSYQTGKLGMRLSAMDRNKTVSGSGNNGYVVASALAAQVGSDVEVASSSAPFAVPHIEYLEVGADGTVTLSYDVVGVAGAEFPYIYKANKDMTQGRKYPIAAATSNTEFAYNPATKKITLPVADLASDSATLTVNGAVTSSDTIFFDGGTVADDVLIGRKINVGGKIVTVVYNDSDTIKVDTPVTVADDVMISAVDGAFNAGDVVIVPYSRKAEVGKKIRNDVELQAKSGRCVLDLTCSDICDPEIKYHCVIDLPLVKVNGSFDLASADEGMQHPFGFESLVQNCAVDKYLWDMYIA